jgi:toxin-antitoxin system PIN domain toxin
VIAVDTNVLVPCVRTEYPHHPQAWRHVRELAEGPASWALPWPCIHEFLAIVTNPRIFRVPMPPHEAMQVIDALLESPRLHLLSEGPAYWQTLQRLLARGHVTGPRVHDARVAALCLAHGVTELWTADRDFDLFPELATRVPWIDA